MLASVLSPEARAWSPDALRDAATGKKASVYSGDVPSLILF